MGDAKKYFITPQSDSLTLVELLKTTLKSTMSPEVIIRAGGVWLNRKRLTNSQQVITSKDTVIVYVSPKQMITYKLLEELIVFEDDDLLVVNKPPGLSACADRSHLYNNMTHGAAVYLQSKGFPYTPSPITRLDYMVSGLMLFPKSKRVERELFRLTKDRMIKKSYFAEMISDRSKVLPGCIRIQDRLVFKDKAYRDSLGKLSHSLFIRRKEPNDFPCYTVILFTGRRHQIRYHAATYLSPLRGDDLYGQKTTKRCPIGLKAIGLNFKLFGKKYRLRLLDR